GGPTAAKTVPSEILRYRVARVSRSPNYCPAADTKTPPGWAPRAGSSGNPRVPLRPEGSAWETHGRARSFSLLLPPALGKGSRRRLTRLGIEGEALLPPPQRVPLAFVGQAVTNRIA